MQKKWIKPVVAIAAVPVIAIGAFQMVKAYEAGTAFQPNGNNRELQVNQVVFSGEEDTTAQKNNEEKEGESELWEKDKTAEDSLSPELKNSADYLFQTGRTNLPDGAQNINLAGEEANNSLLPGDGTNGNGNNGYIYDVTGDRDNADLVIGTGGQNGGISGTGTGAGTGSGSGQGGTTPAVTPKPSDPSQTPAPQPTTRPADTVKDPETIKKEPNLYFTLEKYDENNTLQNPEVRINTSDSAKENGNYLYLGQTVTDRDLYNTLDTYVLEEKSWDGYYWGEQDFGEDNYVKIAGVSFDGGKTWISDYPVTIPAELQAGQMVIRVAYRFRKSDSQWNTKDVSYDPAENRTYVLKEKLTQSSQIIDSDKLANPYQQYAEVGSTMKLYEYQSNLMEGYGAQLTELFPGWMENGQPVPWVYPVKKGRHILEPADRIPVSDEYVVKLKYEPIPEEYLGEDRLYPLQTLTAYTSFDGILEIPEYVQAVDPEYRIVAYTVKIPETVLYVDTEDLIVRDNYVVDDNNPCLHAGDDGILYNKNGARVLGIPYSVEELTIPSKVEEVSIPTWNTLQKIHLSTEEVSQIPEIELKNLHSYCEISMNEKILNDFMDRYETYLEGFQLKTDVEDTVYTVKDHLSTDQEGNLRYVLKSASKTVRLPESIKNIEKQAFSAAATVNLVVPENIDNLTLEENSLKDSKIKVIWCYNKTQQKYLEEQLKNAGEGAAGIQVKIVTEKEITTKLGYTYIVTEPEGTARLLAAPKDIVYFDGTVTSDDGTNITITAIGDEAFKDHTALEWVILPQSTKRIGMGAFRGCTALQGVLIDSRDEFTIGNNAFADCTAIRFVAANAPAVMTEDNYAPVFTDEIGNSVFYIPSTHSDDPGCYWNQNPDAGCAYFESWVGVVEYSVENIGGQGKMLYGKNSFGNAWLALRAGKNVDEQVILPAATQEIMACAMYQTHSPSGSYTINWDDLWMMLAVDDYAFYDSGLSGEVHYGVSGYYSYLMKHAFEKCGGITGVTIHGTIESIGEGCFFDCSGLVNVTFEEFDSDSVQAALHSNMFDGCEKIQKLTISGNTPPHLTVPTRGVSFRLLGYDIAMEKEKGLLSVPEKIVQTYLDAWKYSVLGYKDDEELQNAAESAAFDALLETGECWTSEQKEAWKAAKIAEGQQTICNWLGIEYSGDTANTTSYVNESDALALMDSETTVSDGNALPSVSGGDAVPANDGNTEPDNTQEETVQ